MSYLNNILSDNIEMEKLELQEKKDEIYKEIDYEDNLEQNIRQVTK